MKNKLFILFILFSLKGFCQVPDTETFTLDTVVTVVNPTTDDLTDCFSDAVADLFDPEYTSYTANSLLRFRNYATPFPEYGGTGGIGTSTSSTTVDVDYPSTSTNGLLILQVATKTNTTFTDPSGWTRIGGWVGTNSYAWYYKITTGSETGNLTVTADSSSNMGGIMYFYKYVNQTTSTGGEVSGSVFKAVFTGRAVDGILNDLCGMYCIVFGEISASTNQNQPLVIIIGDAVGWVTDSNLNTSSGGGYTFMAVSYLYESTETSSLLAMPYANSTHSLQHLLIKPL